MAKKQEPLLILIASLLPWWVDVPLGIAGFFGCRLVRDKTAKIIVNPDLGATGLDGVSGTMLRALAHGFATVGMYIVPIAFAIGAVMSIAGRRKRRKLVDRATESDAASFVSGLSWTDFEALVGEAFRRRGFTVIDTGGGGADGGVDLLLTKGRERWLVQCKHWRANKVGVAIVRELYGVMTAKGATGGYVVTSGSFTRDALDFVSGRNIEAVDGPALLALVRGIDPTSVPALTSSPATTEATPVVASGPEASSSATIPACPKCGAEMVQRTAKAGPTPGQVFWGCSRYPSCRGTREL